MDLIVVIYLALGGSCYVRFVTWWSLVTVRYDGLSAVNHEPTQGADDITTGNENKYGGKVSKFGVMFAELSSSLCGGKNEGKDDRENHTTDRTAAIDNAKYTSGVFTS